MEYSSSTLNLLPYNQIETATVVRYLLFANCKWLKCFSVSLSLSDFFFPENKINSILLLPNEVFIARYHNNNCDYTKSNVIFLWFVVSCLFARTLTHSHYSVSSFSNLNLNFVTHDLVRVHFIRIYVFRAQKKSLTTNSDAKETKQRCKLILKCLLINSFECSI